MFCYCCVFDKFCNTSADTVEDQMFTLFYLILTIPQFHCCWNSPSSHLPFFAGIAPITLLTNWTWRNTFIWCLVGITYANYEQSATQLQFMMWDSSFGVPGLERIWMVSTFGASGADFSYISLYKKVIETKCSKCRIVGNWTCSSFLKMFHLSSKRLLWF